MGTASADHALKGHAVQPANMGGQTAREFRGDKLGSFRGQRAKPLAFGITQLEWSERSSEAMRTHVGDDRHAAKKLSTILECSPRTAENFLLGRTTPSGIHFLRAYASIPEFTAEVRRLTRMEQSMDPLFEQAAMAFLRVAQARLPQLTEGETTE